jgi:hypothetical protein
MPYRKAIQAGLGCCQTSRSHCACVTSPTWAREDIDAAVAAGRLALSGAPADPIERTAAGSNLVIALRLRLELTR